MRRSEAGRRIKRMAPSGVPRILGIKNSGSYDRAHDLSVASLHCVMTVLRRLMFPPGGVWVPLATETTDMRRRVMNRSYKDRPDRIERIAKCIVDLGAGRLSKGINQPSCANGWCMHSPHQFSR